MLAQEKQLGRAESKQRLAQKLRAFRKANGLVAHGMVAPLTSVFLRIVTLATPLQDSAWFSQVPNHCIRPFSLEKVKSLRCLEEKILALELGGAKDHKYGANGGFNLGISIVSGGRHAKHGKSGSLHWAKALKAHPKLRKEMICLLRSILDEAYGDARWYINTKALCAKLNQDSREKRTLPGIPATGIWLSTEPKAEKVHCDENVAGPTFILSTYPAVPGMATLCKMSTQGELTQTTVLPGMVVAGKWASSAHCNLKLDKAAATGRTSWTIYLEKRAFGKNYKFVHCKGYVT